MEATKEQRNYAMFCHLIALSGLLIPLGTILGPLILWLIKREESTFIDFHGKQALNFNISIMIYMIVSGLLTIIIIGILFVLVVFVLWLVFAIMATVKASNGETYRYPLSIPFLR
ncbi:DUF4870 domain-containing protein [Salicibibacter kimchii]|uniref:DUF4870 domain-containing protein n=1 Tax=Salicibibacter kimchii TaxID=2099786 RepID=A0A345C1T2_9BACI|nr:DUF4870 domain-containing protein [Salicibibacter kimchii]AXF57163.1 DUF4870 domain-containing protein [Salicibibacter kimchii]